MKKDKVIQFDIVKKTKTELKVFLILISVSIGILMLPDADIYRDIIDVNVIKRYFIFSLLIIAPLTIGILLHLRLRGYKVVGTISFEPDSIQIDKKGAIFDFKIPDIDYLHLTLRGYKEQIKVTSAYQGGNYVDGLDNVLIIKTDSEKHKVKFFADKDSGDDYSILKDYAVTWDSISLFNKSYTVDIIR